MHLSTLASFIKSKNMRRCEPSLMMYFGRPSRHYICLPDVGLAMILLYYHNIMHLEIFFGWKTGWFGQEFPPIVPTRHQHQPTLMPTITTSGTMWLQKWGRNSNSSKSKSSLTTDNWITECFQALLKCDINLDWALFIDKVLEVTLLLT